MKEQAIVIMNGNLRLSDNPAFYEAASSGKRLILVYLLPTNKKQIRPLGSSHLWWLSESLKKIPVVLRTGDPLRQIASLVEESKADSIYWNQVLDPQWRKVFDEVNRWAKKKKLKTFVGEGNYLIDPRTLKTGQGTFFKVFTPFWKAALKDLKPAKQLLKPSFQLASGIESDALLSSSCDLSNYWKPGEGAARKALKQFLKQGLNGYDTFRDRMDLEGTSSLSPYLHFGEVSIREVWHAVKSSITKKNEQSANVYLSELGWREFSYYLLFYFPTLGQVNFRSQFNRMKWKNNKSDFNAWKEGKTGYPVVDAAMRQLKESGWMHNRARMVVGSFLTKHLLIDWRWGEEWFWENLVDGDPAQNAFNWQWVAGCGADAAPYFRIFNPTLQQQKFDPEGKYVQSWVPELSKEKLSPIVDHKFARERALAMFERVKN